VCSTVNAEEQPKKKFYKDKERGWFWYEVLPEQPKKVEPEEIPPQISTSKPQEAQPIEAAELPPEQVTFSAQWVRENIKIYKDIAWSNPTEENMRAFLYMQRFALDRSQDFQRMGQQVIQGDPYLDEIANSPTASGGKQLLAKKADKAKVDLIKTISTRAGLFFFYKEDCSLCEEQGQIVDAFVRLKGFDAKAISMDGTALKSGLFPNYSIDSGQAKLLNIKTFPALYLVNKEGTIAPVGQGFMAGSQVMNRILVAAKRHKWVTDDEVAKTQIAFNSDNSLTKALAGTDQIAHLSNKYKGKTIPPSELIEFIKASTTTNTQE